MLDVNVLDKIVIFDERAATGSAEAPSQVLQLSEGIASQRVLRVAWLAYAQSPSYVTCHLSGASDTESIAIALEVLEQQFCLLAEQWARETGMLSSISKKAMHPTYQRIIGMGDKAVRPILRRLQERPDHWFWALSAITGENPVPQESAGNLRQMADAWILWGRRRGYIA